MALEKFIKKLQDKESKEHTALLKLVKSNADLSRKEMAKHYSVWDCHDQVFRSERKIDKEDRAAQAKGQPPKMVVPMTFSQVMTFVSYGVMTLMQNKRFFELEPTGTEDNPLREPFEVILERDTRRNKWTSFLVQFLLDLGRFSIGCAEVCWEESFRNIRVPQTNEVQGPFGAVGTEETFNFQKVPTFVGNRVHPISPYRFLPDTRLPLTRFQEGEFCASEDMWSMSSLKALSSAGLFNLDKIPKMTSDEHTKRHQVSRIDTMETRSNPNQGGTTGDGGPDGMVKNGTVVVTKMCLDIVPKHFEVDDGEPLGDEDFPIRYICWFANDKTIIRFEEAYYLHGQYPYICAQFLPDQHKTINEGLAGVCEQISTYITFLANAHKAAQANALESKWVVDPAGIDIKTLESRSPYIFMKKNASQTGVDRYIKQFKTEDPTVNAMADISAAKALLEACTGYSGMMQGEHSAGRRSATQDRAVIQGATGRAKTTIASIWDQSMEPLGKQLIANNRQEMDFETFSRILGVQNDSTKPSTEELFSLFKADPVAIAASEDFFVFDGTLPSEKSFLAQSLQEIFMTLLSNPEVMMALGYGPEHLKSLLDDIYNLRGVTNSRLPAPKPPALMPPTNVVQGPSPAPAVAV